jgi:hypothetical protein
MKKYYRTLILIAIIATEIAFIMWSRHQYAVNFIETLK